MICNGQGDKFFDSTEKTDGFAWLLPIYNPFHLLTLFTFFSYAVLVPFGYTAIYKFRRQDSYDVAGLSERSRLIRRHRNIVTTKFNLLNWIFETSGFMVLISEERMFTILYFLVTCSISPVLYYVGIELNRQAAKKRMLDIFKDLKDDGRL